MTWFFLQRNDNWNALQRHWNATETAFLCLPVVSRITREIVDGFWWILSISSNWREFYDNEQFGMTWLIVDGATDEDYDEQSSGDDNALHYITIF